MTAIRRMVAALTRTPARCDCDPLVADIRSTAETARREAEMFRGAVSDDRPIRAWCRLAGVDCG